MMATSGPSHPTFVDLCGLPQDPNAGRVDYQLEGHSIVPLAKDPSGSWDGPDVAIMALPGKDHSQHREHIGTLYPHFSVRAKDWRYSLTSDGQEELYRYSTDPYEFENLASDPEFTEVKERLKKQLVELRDGQRWTSHNSLPERSIAGFELEGKLVGNTEFKVGKRSIAQVESDGDAAVRIRAAGKRVQVWVNNRVYSDQLFESEITPGVLSVNSRLSDIRLREL